MPVEITGLYDCGRAGTECIASSADGIGNARACFISNSFDAGQGVTDNTTERKMMTGYHAAALQIILDWLESETAGLQYVAASSRQASSTGQTGSLTIAAFLLSHVRAKNVYSSFSMVVDARQEGLDYSCVQEDPRRAGEFRVA